MAALPFDIIIDILRCSPVKDLLRFMCVSKTWCSLIGDPDFIELHLSHSLETNLKHSLILRNYPREFFCVSLDSLKTSQKHNLPPSSKILASCHGLLVLSKDEHKISLWNPSTRKRTILPSYRIELSPMFYYRRRNIGYGFGYDPTSHDYKLVRIVQFYCDVVGLKSQVEVYSLRTNSWRRIKEFPNFHLHDMYGVYASNALHWVATKEHANPGSKIQIYIVAFDIRTQEYRFVELPDCLDDVPSRHVTKVEVLGGRLCLIRRYRVIHVVDIWMMKEYGVKESWTQLTSVNQFESLLPLALGFSMMMNRFWTDSIWSDLRKKMAGKLTSEGTVPSFYFVDGMFVESLVPVMIKQEEETESREGRTLGGKLS